MRRLARLLRCAAAPVAAGLLLACAASVEQSAQSEPQADATDANKAGALVRDSSIGQTATQPLADLNVMRDEIPAILLAARKAPYGEPAGHSCTAAVNELQALDAALGPDIDASSLPAADPSLVEKAVGAAGQMAMDSVRGSVNTVVDGVLPLRSWVRRLSGAEEHAGAVAAAARAGATRRAYLKGWMEGTNCKPQP